MPYTEGQFFAAAGFWIKQLPDEISSETKGRFAGALIEILRLEAGRMSGGFGFGTNHDRREDPARFHVRDQPSLHHPGKMLVDAGLAAGLEITDQTFKLGVVCQLNPNNGTVGIIHSVDDFLKSCIEIHGGDQKCIEIIYTQPGLEYRENLSPP